MACRGSGQGGNSVLPLILIVIYYVVWSVIVFVTHEHQGAKNYANFADATASHPACVMR